MSILPMMPDFSGLLPAVHGAAGDGEGGLLVLLDKMLDGLSGLLEPGGFSGVLGGISALGFNVHPMLVHFPIALLTAFLFMEVLGAIRKNQDIRKAANWFLYLGALSAVVTAAAGIVAEHIVVHDDEVHAIMERHELLGLTVASLSILLSLWRWLGKAYQDTSMSKGLNGFLMLVIWVCLFFGADLGGSMVYQYGVGVQKLQDPDSPHRHGESGQDHAHAHTH